MITSWWSVAAVCVLSCTIWLDIEKQILGEQHRRGKAVAVSALALAVIVVADGWATAVTTAVTLLLLLVVILLVLSWWERRNTPVAVAARPHGQHLHYVRGCLVRPRYVHATDVCWCNPDSGTLPPTTDGAQ